MGQRAAFAIIAVLACTAMAGGDARAACPVQSAAPHDRAKLHKPVKGCVDLNAVPQISEQIVSREPLAVPGKTPMPPPDVDNTPYTGPRLGLTKPEPGVRPAPTVGYKWALD